MYLRRKLEEKILKSTKNFGVIALLGPRQSGKTTLSKKIFPAHNYLNIEELDLRQYPKEDPRHFLSTCTSNKGVLLDEIQHVPELLSYIRPLSKLLF